jgi:hypothetical protein
MPLKRFLFGPDWRSRDPERRARAIARSSDPALEQDLPRIAREDPDERVRLAALKRLDDPRRYLEAARADPSPELRREAHALAMRQLAGERPSALSDAQLALLASEVLNEAESESLIRRARSGEVRQALLKRIHRLSLLVELALAAPDPELRRMSLERIEDPGALERIARRARGKDKRIEKLAGERLAALRGPHAVGGPASAEALCREAEAALRHPPDDLDALRARLRAACEALALPENDPQLLRLRNALAILERFAERREAEALPDPPDPRTEECAAPAEPPIEEPPVEAPAEAGAEEGSPSEDRAAAPSSAAAPEGAPIPATEAGEARRLLAELATALDEGALAQAERAAAALRGLSLSGRERNRLHGLQGKLAELRRWKAWTLREHRERLIEEMARLPGLGLHPDALATRVRELRAQWQHLHREIAAPPAFEGRFRALARAALAPARAFFRRRDALRARRSQEIEGVLATVEAALDPADSGQEAPTRAHAGALAAMRRRLSALGRELADLSPADRARLGERLRRALAALDERRESYFRSTLEAKRALLDRLEQAAGLPPERALRALERIEAEWRRLGRARSGEETALRERLAAIAARIREKHRESVASAERAEAERRAQGEALLQRAEALGETPSSAEVERLAEAARALRPLPPDLQRALDAAIREARAHVRAALRERTAAELHALLAPAAEAPIDPGEATEAARRCCVALEELAGLPSPAEDAGWRLRLQMERLAARLGRGEAEEPLVAARALLGDWRRIAAALPDPEPHAARLRRAIDALARRLYPPDPPREEAAAGDPRA